MKTISEKIKNSNRLTKVVKFVIFPFKALFFAVALPICFMVLLIRRIVSFIIEKSKPVQKDPNALYSKGLALYEENKLEDAKQLSTPFASKLMATGCASAITMNL